ncbi:hypothetical protein CAOG_02519 [Capsaspora owczarzaki ATCC 30864]|uniref:hypothetical protein n=1 Tax=Capsaspora owczarzaki (strain ATCC 30864) TaxID=595528 RepID=UPI0001FE6392|nr:hypothetical protein CAOG_02519 [Capsaspora owczarzaki ATCC 30864]|eukprot:XP_004349269.1 hypothetical protein CAOG_02519 [Capsaspora owczarzaki ATCC 30864]
MYADFDAVLMPVLTMPQQQQPGLIHSQQQQLDRHRFASSSPFLINALGNVAFCPADVAMLSEVSPLDATMFSQAFAKQHSGGSSALSTSCDAMLASKAGAGDHFHVTAFGLSSTTTTATTATAAGPTTDDGTSMALSGYFSPPLSSTAGPNARFAPDVIDLYKFGDDSVTQPAHGQLPRLESLSPEALDEPVFVSELAAAVAAATQDAALNRTAAAKNAHAQLLPCTNANELMHLQTVTASIPDAAVAQALSLPGPDYFGPLRISSADFGLQPALGAASTHRGVAIQHERSSLALFDDNALINAVYNNERINNWQPQPRPHQPASAASAVDVLSSSVGIVSHTTASISKAQRYQRLDASHHHHQHQHQSALHLDAILLQSGLMHAQPGSAAPRRQRRTSSHSGSSSTYMDEISETASHVSSGEDRPTFHELKLKPANPNKQRIKVQGAIEPNVKAILDDVPAAMASGRVPVCACSLVDSPLRSNAMSYLHGETAQSIDKHLESGQPVVVLVQLDREKHLVVSKKNRGIIFAPQATTQVMRRLNCLDCKLSNNARSEFSAILDAKEVNSRTNELETTVQNFAIRFTYLARGTPCRRDAACVRDCHRFELVHCFMTSMPESDTIAVVVRLGPNTYEHSA